MPNLMNAGLCKTDRRGYGAIMQVIIKGLFHSAIKDFEPAMLVQVCILCEKLLERTFLEQGGGGMAASQ